MAGPWRFPSNDVSLTDFVGAKLRFCARSGKSPVPGGKFARKTTDFGVTKSSKTRIRGFPNRAHVDTYPTRPTASARVVFSGSPPDGSIGAVSSVGRQVRALFLQGTQRFNAGWSSPVARQAHNLKVIGSNPIPATKLVKKPRRSNDRRGFLLVADSTRLTSTTRLGRQIHDRAMADDPAAEKIGSAEYGDAAAVRGCSFKAR
jgi:hypothetical protein